MTTPAVTAVTAASNVSPGAAVTASSTSVTSITSITDTPARPARPAISCVVPAYNEAANLGLMLTGLTVQLGALTDRWEIIVVDDGSRDPTPAAIAPFLQRPGVRYVRLSRNFRQE